MKILSDDGAKELVDAIIKTAAEDYLKALEFQRTGVIRECERFFRSGYYRVLTEIDGEMMIQKLKNVAKNKGFL